MSKKLPKQNEIPRPNVVPLTEEKRRVIATDQKSQRVIAGIGQQRIAFDLLTRITRLAPRTGDLQRLLPFSVSVPIRSLVAGSS